MKTKNKQDDPKVEFEKSDDIGQTIASALLVTYPKRLQFLCKKPILSVIIYLALTVAIQVSLTSIWGGFYKTDGVRDITEDLGYPIVTIAFSLIIYIYFWLPNALVVALNEIKDEVFESDQISVSQSAVDFTSLRRPRQFLYAVGAAISIGGSFFSPDEQPFWYTVHPAVQLSAMMSWILGWVALFGLALNILLVARFLNNLFSSNRIIVIALHPDQSGGLRPIGQFIFRLTYFALVSGFLLLGLASSAITRGSITKDYTLLADTLLYIVVVPFLFYFLVRGPHRAMVDFRSRLILETSTLYSRSHRSAHEKLPRNDKTLKTTLEDMNALRELQQHESAYPIWPFSLRIGLSYIINILLPLVPTLLGLAAETVI